MEAYLKRGVKYIVYVAMTTAGLVLIVLGFQHKSGRSAEDRSINFAPQVFADVPYSQASYPDQGASYSQGSYYSEGSYGGGGDSGDSGGGGGGGGGDDDDDDDDGDG